MHHRTIMDQGVKAVTRIVRGGALRLIDLCFLISTEVSTMR